MAMREIAAAKSAMIEQNSSLASMIKCSPMQLMFVDCLTGAQ